jgi:DNA repair protein RecO (recombination protein O)
MIQKTKGIVLRSLKYGETSVISTIFTELFGVQSYMIKGVRSSRIKNNRAGLLQPATLLDMVVYQKTGSNIQQIKEFQPSYIYRDLQEQIIKNSVGLFSAELLLRLLPEHAPMQELFRFTMDYFCIMDKMPVDEVANFPVYFIIECSRLLGYEVQNHYTETTPYLNLEDGSFSHVAPLKRSLLTEEDLRNLSSILRINRIDELKNIEMNAASRYHILEWYIEFLHRHAQHLGNIKSLKVLQTVLH